METTIAKRFRYYANHENYDPDEGMCKLLKEEKEFGLLFHLAEYMHELGSDTGHFLQSVFDSEDWDITPQEVYLDWDNRPYIENPDTFGAGDKVTYQGAEGEVIYVHGAVCRVEVLFEDGRSHLFTHNGRLLGNHPRELKHDNTRNI